MAWSIIGRYLQCKCHMVNCRCAYGAEVSRPCGRLGIGCRSKRRKSGCTTVSAGSSAGSYAEQVCFIGYSGEKSNAMIDYLPSSVAPAQHLVCARISVLKKCAGRRIEIHPAVGSDRSVPLEYSRIRCSGDCLYVGDNRSGSGKRGGKD